MPGRGDPEAGGRHDGERGESGSDTVDGGYGAAAEPLWPSDESDAPSATGEAAGSAYGSASARHETDQVRVPDVTPVEQPTVHTRHARPPHRGREGERQPVSEKSTVWLPASHARPSERGSAHGGGQVPPHARPTEPAMASPWASTSRGGDGSGAQERGSHERGTHERDAHDPAVPGRGAHDPAAPERGVPERGTHDPATHERATHERGSNGPSAQRARGVSAGHDQRAARDAAAESRAPTTPRASVPRAAPETRSPLVDQKAAVGQRIPGGDVGAGRSPAPHPDNDTVPAPSGPDEAGSSRHVGREDGDDGGRHTGDRADGDRADGDRDDGGHGDRRGGRPRRRRLLVCAVVVLLLAAAGGASAVPDVSNRLGLPWAPNLPQGEPPEPLDVSMTLRGPAGAAEGPTPSGVASRLEGVAADPVLGTLSGSVVGAAEGTELWSSKADTALTPASTTKILTGAAALLALDPATRVPTRVVQGADPGTVVLVAGGDITLSSLPEGEESIFPGAAHLAELAAQVREQTGGEVDEVLLDLGAFDGPETASGWAPEDAPSTYAVDVEPVMLDGGRSDPTDSHSMGVDDPAGVLAGKLADALGAEAGGTTTAPENADVLGEVSSAPIVEWVDLALRRSDNVLTEALARQVALAEGAEPSFEGAARATLDVLARHDFDVSGVELHDASGLSVDNRVPARTLTDVLAVAAAPDGSDPRTEKLRPLLGGLPIAGGTGTLADRYEQAPASEGRGWVRAKTGTLNGVNALAGLVLDSDGRVLVFALLSGSDAGIPEVRARLDEVVARLRGCGCD